MIVIATPTGQIGHQVLDNVLDSDVPIRVIARNPSRLSPKAHGRVEVVQGSLTDIDVITEAFAGANSVFWLLPPNPNAASFNGHMQEFTRPLCEAITRQNIKRLVYVAGLGHKEATYADSTGRVMDEMIEKTGVSYRVLRMPAFMENLLWQVKSIKHQGMFFYPISGDRKLPTCATRDIAAVAAKLLLDNTWNGQDYFPILGYEDLSYNEMAQIMSEVLQRPIRYQQVSGEAYKATLMQHGSTEASAKWLVNLLVSVDGGLYNTEPRTPESTTPTSFRQWCEEVLKPAVLS
ncbi:NAD(P)H-binding protein [Shimazuella sp. AN120528]|uniref:NmrA family NAD(P)-binding protein n=1 Tax=Shimazuella soli TaxID=1892854 RepID=UPI001F0D9333|nr:NAD(P)H-binding protein [Shimazuella soli]MCH5585629.1 NAD(P)H-binding protein [Shimazuella soli]